MNELAKYVLTGRVVDVGEVKITRTTLGKRGGSRYLVYLPTTRNYLWEELRARNSKVRLFIELPKDTEGPTMAKAEATIMH
jgi:hypothetical protein